MPGFNVNTIVSGFNSDCSHYGRVPGFECSVVHDNRLLR